MFRPLLSLLAAVLVTQARAEVGAGAAPSAGPTTGPAGAAVRVMSFNVRTAKARDGEDAWERRKAMLIDTIRAYGPDLLGTQEVVAEQADYLRQQLPEYGFAGGGRDDGARGGEFSPVMFRLSRFELLASGQYWLSATPQKAGSRGWDAALPRVMTWARLHDRATGTRVLYANTHWDHKGVRARVESGTLMRRLLEAERDASAWGAGGPPTVIVTGDFNSAETSPQYRSLTGAGDGGAGEPAMRLLDAFREVHPTVGSEEATFHGFKGTRDGHRIDWILHSPEWVALGAGIDRTQRDGHYPSDHYAVTAELAPGPPPPGAGPASRPTTPAVGRDVPK